MQLITPQICISSTKATDNRLRGSALAHYAFAGSAEASYLGQFTDTRSVFINEIPPSLAGIPLAHFANWQLGVHFLILISRRISC
jgi:hypothetical protein